MPETFHSKPADNTPVDLLKDMAATSLDMAKDALEADAIPLARVHTQEALEQLNDIEQRLSGDADFQSAVSQTSGLPRLPISIDE